MELSFHFLSEDLASWRPSQEPSVSRRKSPTELWGGPDAPASCRPESGWLSEEGEPVPPRPPETALSARDGSRSSASPALIPTCKAGGLEEQADSFSVRPGVLLQAQISLTSWCFKKWQVQVEETKKSIFLTFLLQMCLQKLEAAPRLFQLVFLPRVPTGAPSGHLVGLSLRRPASVLHHLPYSSARARNPECVPSPTWRTFTGGSAFSVCRGTNTPELFCFRENWLMWGRGDCWWLTLRVPPSLDLGGGGVGDGEP